MKILLIVRSYLPKISSDGIMMGDLAKAFRRAGHDVTVISADHQLKTSFQQTMEHGITVLRAKTGDAVNGIGLRRGINEVLLSFTLWRRAKAYFQTHPHDIIVYYSPTIFFGGLVKKLKKLWNAKSYLILRDIFPQWCVDTGVMQEGLAVKFFRRKERLQYRVADVIGVQSPKNLPYFNDLKHSKSPQLDVLYNWRDCLNECSVKVSYRERLGLEDKVILVYGGTLGVAQDIDNLIRLAQGYQSNDSCHFVFVGRGSEVDRIREKIKTLQLTNITYVPPIGHDDYLSLLAECDVGLISLDRHLKTHNFPCKLFDYMMQSLPILASINPGNDLRSVIEDAAAGFVADNGEDETFFQYAKKLTDDKILRQTMGFNARQLVESRFSPHRAADQILEAMR